MTTETTTTATPAVASPATVAAAGVAAIQSSTTGAQPAAETKPAATADTSKATESAAGAPEKYENFKLPDGVTIDPDMLTEFTALAKEAKLDQKNAQRTLDLGTKAMQKFGEKQVQLFNDTKAAWLAEAKADKEFGGDKLAENLAVAKVAMEKFATPKLREFLDQTGLGNHPDMVRAWVNIGKQLSGDQKIVTGSFGEKNVAGVSGPNTDTALGNKMYPNQQQK
jgi:hypothetical protein